MQQISGKTLFSLKGVEVKVHISLLFLLLYILLVATASFPFVVESSGINPEEIKGTSLIWAFVFAVALIASIFIHEFSHVLVAQSKGIKVRQIILMMLGGVSQMEKIPEDPASEFKIAIIGPLVSLALAGLLFGMRPLTDSGTIAFFCFWVGRTNLVLAIFNLIPAFPTDGGRVLRAVLVTKLGRLRGTQVAVQISHVFAWIFGLFGFFYFNILLVLIAFFIYAASRSELFMLWGQTILKGVKVKDVMTPLEGISENSSLSSAVAEMTRTKQLILPVTDSRGEGGSVITSEMIRLVPRFLWDQKPIKEVAFQIPKAISVDDSLEEIWQMTLAIPYGGVPVMENHRVVGIIKTSDLLEAFELQRLNDGSRTSSVFPWSVKVQYPKPI